MTQAHETLEARKETGGVERAGMSELLRLGEEGLRAHVAERALLARARYGVPTLGNLELLLQDSECVRKRTRVVFEFGDMASHQFGQPMPDPEDATGRGVVLCLRPTLLGREDLVPVAVAYLIPVINYGEIATDEECLWYGATLFGIGVEEFYERVCSMADEAGITS